MNPHVQALFEFTRNRVTEQHIRDYSPSDPGYPSYVLCWLGILESGLLPRETDFDLTEVIGLTSWVSAEKEAEPERFREYRRFTSAVALGLVNAGHFTDDVRPASYLARDLFVDAGPVESESFPLVRNVMLPTRELLAATEFEEEFPFFTLGAMLFAHEAGEHEEVVRLAALLIEDEQAVRDNPELDYGIQSSRFLFGLTVYDQFNDEWRRLMKRVTNPLGDETLRLVLEELAGG